MRLSKRQNCVDVELAVNAKAYHFHLQQNFTSTRQDCSFRGLGQDAFWVSVSRKQEFASDLLSRDENKSYWRVMNEDGTEHQTSKTNFQWTRLIAQFDEKAEKSFDASLI